MRINKSERITDQAYLDFLKGEPCIFTGVHGGDSEGIDPMHIGTYGKGLKSDDEALPAQHAIHHSAHQRGEMTVIRQVIPDDVLRAALRALARERYRAWRAGL